jgi:ribosomal protein S18 acetylase RimI-like enzyme
VLQWAAMSIVRLTPDHAVAAARLHMAGQPGSFLTSLGPDVLALLYRALPASPVGFGFASVADPQDLPLGAAHQSPIANPQSPMIQGFVSATTSVGRLFWLVGLRRLPQFLPLLARRFAQQPALAARTLQTVLYPWLVRGDAGRTEQPGAELLSIMVEPALRSRGIGSALLQALRSECAGCQIERLAVTVDAANSGARRFYERHGFRLAHTFTLYGRAMCSYHLVLK